MAKTQSLPFRHQWRGHDPRLRSVCPPNQAALNAMTHIGVQSMRQMVDMNQQYLEFIKHRLDEDIKTGERIGACKDVPDVVSAVSDSIRRRSRNTQRKWRASPRWLSRRHPKR
jgi:hypothetical protein